jgi:hypothetical protein
MIGLAPCNVCSNFLEPGSKFFGAGFQNFDIFWNRVPDFDLVVLAVTSSRCWSRALECTPTRLKLFFRSANGDSASTSEVKKTVLSNLEISFEKMFRKIEIWNLFSSKIFGLFGLFPKFQKIRKKTTISRGRLRHH